MRFSRPTLVSALSLFVYVQASDVHHSHHKHAAHVHNAALPTNWYHEESHPVHDLFRRGIGLDGIYYPDVGTPEWRASFPPAKAIPDVNRLPPAWVAALDIAIASGKIPDVPQARSPAPETNPVYPPDVNPMAGNICSATYKCRIPGDLWDAPAGVFASSFDDGPLPSSTALIEFLRGHSAKSTHFMIGWNIVTNPQLFLDTLGYGGDIAVHTWSHPYMTTLTNLEVVAELGWTMQLIHNSTGGRVPRYWRPPYGDVDLRVRSIAKEVFGMDTVVWNQDTIDWGAQDVKQITDSMTNFLALPKDPGLMVLEHESSNTTVTGFIESFPKIQEAGWRFVSLAEAFNVGAYQNAPAPPGIRPKGILAVQPNAAQIASAAAKPPVTTSSSSIPPPVSTVIAPTPVVVTVIATTPDSAQITDPPAPTGGASLSSVPCLSVVLSLFCFAMFGL